MTLACPLCTSEQTALFYEDRKRPYHQCSECQLTFVPSTHHLNQNDEKQIYDFHQNAPEDKSYRNFLNKLLKPLIEKLPPNAKGLDFGCGLGPTIQPMLEAQGFTVENYDIYYQNYPQLLEQQYDFITCTEAIEHFSQPRKELLQLNSILQKDCYLGIMTKRSTSLEAFQQWHYKNDPTHISFFSEQTFRWITHWLNYTLEFPGNDTVILQKR